MTRGVHVRGPVFRIGWLGALLLGLGTGLGRVLGWAVRAARRHPVTALGVAGLAGLGWVFWRLDGALVATVCICAGGAVALAAWLWPEGWARWVAGPVRARWLRKGVYGRTWEKDMIALGLDRGEYLPGLVRVTPGEGGDLLRVRLAPGTLADDWDAQRQRIASTYDARIVRIRRTASPSHIDVHVRYGSPVHGEAPGADESAPAEGAFPL